MSENRHMRARRITVIALSVAMTLGVAGCAAVDHCNLNIRTVTSCGTLN